MRTLVALFVVLSAAPAAAQPSMVTFDRAIALSSSTPGVEGTGRALEARQAGDQSIAGTTQTLSVQAQPGVRVASEQDRGFEGQITITQTWYLADLTGARRRTARTERQVLAAQQRAAALTARLDAARRWIDLWQLVQAQHVVGEERELAIHTRELVERAVRAGVRTRVDADEVDAYLADVAIRAIAAEGQRHEASLALAIAMGQPPTHELAPAGPLPEPILPPEPEQLLAEVERLPSVAVERLGAAAQRAYEVELAAQASSQLMLGVYAQRESPTGFIAEGFFGVNAPTFDHGERARSVALGEAEAHEGQAEQARLEAQHDLSVAIHDVEHQRGQEQAVNGVLIPALSSLVEHREAALRGGEGTILELLAARRRLLDARSRAVSARAQRTWAEVRLWLLLAELQRGRAAPR